MADAPILVTGAGNGIGFYTACYLHELGYPVIGHFHQTLSDKEKFFAVCSDTYQADLRDRKAVATLCDSLTHRHAALRGIIHNASSFSPMAANVDDACQQLSSFFAVHMEAPFQINMRLKPLLVNYVTQNSTQENPVLADIIHITDIYAENPNAQFANYCATKAGLENLSQSFAKLFAPQVKVNTIQPGPISFKPFHDQAKQSSVLSSTLLARQGTPEAIAKAIASLLDNNYMTGSRIQVDGGRHLTHG